MRAIPVTAALLAVTVACGGSPTTPTPNPSAFSSSGLNFTYLARGTITAVVDGVPWRAVFASGGTTAGSSGFPGAVTASGSDGTGLYLSLGGPLAVGAYDINDRSTFVIFNLAQGLAQRWSTSPLASGVQGTLTITTATSSRVTGTFAFTAVALTGTSPATRTVTNGAFDLSQ